VPRGPGRHVDDAGAVGARIRAARTRLGLSQRDLAFDGCSYAYISRIEAGQRTPSLQVLHEFARRLGVSATYLATGADAPDAVDALDDADLAWRIGRDEHAEEIYRACADDRDAAPARRARALAGLGEVQFDRGELEQARVTLEQAMAETGLDAQRAARASDLLGRIYALRGEQEQALAIYERELARAEGSNDLSEVLRFSTLLANAVLDSGNTGRAQELLAQAIAVADRIDDPVGRARLWWSQSRLHDSQGQPELAARYARLALGVLEDMEQSTFAAVAYLLLAHIENEREHADEAREWLERAEPTLGGTQNRFHRGLWQIERARAFLLGGDYEQAASLAMSALPLVGDASAVDSGRAYALLADVFNALGDRARARELYELAQETLPAIDRNLLRVYSGLAEILEHEGRTDEALGVLKEAMRLRQRVGGPG